MAAGDDDDHGGGALDRREMSPLARRAAATRRRIEAARAAAAATAREEAPRSPSTNLKSGATGKSRMFGAPTRTSPSSPPAPSPASREDRKAGSPYNVGRVATTSFGTTNLATPSGIAARNLANVRTHARKIRVCVPMSAEWFRCGEHLRALAEAGEREDRNPSVAGSNPTSVAGGSNPSNPNPSLWDRDDCLFVARGVLEEGKLNAIIKSLAAHRQLIRRVRRRGGSLAWETHVTETCVTVGLTRHECVDRVKRWEADAGRLLKRVLSTSVEAAQTADAAALLRHCAAVLTWQDAMWMADEAAEASSSSGGGEGEGGVGEGDGKDRSGARMDSNPRAYGACQETHVLHYLERLFCTHVDALDESALASVAAECGLFQSLCAFLDERGASLVAEDRRAGLYALSGIIATESFASHRRLIVGGAAGDGAVTVGNASPMSAGGESSGGEDAPGESEAVADRFAGSIVGRNGSIVGRNGSIGGRNGSSRAATDDEIAAVDARIVRISARLVEPDWGGKHVDPAERRGVVALLDEARRLRRNGEVGGSIPRGATSDLVLGEERTPPARRANARRPMSGRVIADRIRALSAV